MPIPRNVNTHFFKTWSPEMAYVLGFFAADGCMIKNKGGTHYIELCSTDGELIKKIRKLLKSNHKISIRYRKKDWKNLHRIQIGSNEICKDLRNLGFTDRKARNMPFPHIPEKYVRNFVRGYFDGDGNVWSGTIHKKRKKTMEAIQTVFTSCSLTFLEELQSLLSSCLNTTGSISKKKNSNAHRLMYSINDSLLLYHLMYDNLQTDLFLKRKKGIFDEFARKRADAVVV